MVHNGSDRIKSLPDCVDGFVNSVPLYIRIAAAVTCSMSVIGVLVMLYTYIAFKKYRNKAREIILHISLMDFMVALANFIGIVVDFDSLLYSYENNIARGKSEPHQFHDINNFCIAQAAFAVYGTICSLLWTTAFTVYFYILILGDDTKLSRRVSYSFYWICYGLPVIIIGWLSGTGKIGYSPVGGGGWCSLIFEKKIHTKDRFTIFFGYDLWLYVTFIVVFVITVAILCYLKTQIQKDTMSQQGKSTVQSIEKKLLAIPILFIVLRIWSFLLVLITLYTELRSCGIVLFLLGMGAVGDSGQGFFNAIIFCLLNKNIRESYRLSFMKFIRRKRYNQVDTLATCTSPTLDGCPDSSTATATAIGVESSVVTNDGSHELAKPYTKKWHISSARYKAIQNVNT